MNLLFTDTPLMRFNKFFSTVLLCFSLDLSAAASPNDDAAFIVDKHMNEEVVESMRNFAGSKVADALAPQLLEMNVKIIDQDRFAEMVSEQVTDVAVDHFRQGLIDAYLDSFSAWQLSEIVLFLRTGAGTRIVENAPLNTPREEMYVFLPGVMGTKESDVLRLLTPEEAIQYQEFISSAIGIEFNLKGSEIALSTLPLVFSAPAEAAKTQTTLNTPYMLDIVKAKGVLSFPNPIVRNDLILQIQKNID